MLVLLPIDLGRLRVDGAATRIWVDGVESLIPAMEFVLLRYLAERHGEIVTREELVSAALGRTGHGAQQQPERAPDPAAATIPRRTRWGLDPHRPRHRVPVDRAAGTGGCLAACTGS